MWRKVFWAVSIVVFLLVWLVHFYWSDILQSLFILVPLFFLGVYDILQKRSNVLRNYPVIGHIRYFFLMIRPEIQQYFIESNEDGKPFSAEMRELVYERATNTIDTLPFGTQRDVYKEGFESIKHSLAPVVVDPAEARIRVGGPHCNLPYEASRLNISAMSFGALSRNAIRALNRGAKLGNFAHNTGEGGLSPHHLEEGGDLVWQIGTGYFGCRTKDGNFCADQFKDKASHPNVKMNEIKLSQGAKPSHGGILPAAKVSEEIAAIRGLVAGEDCISPPAHSAFSTPKGLLEFVAQLRDLNGGKPVGFKLCIGLRREFMAICKAMMETNIYPDFITIDGAEGGTGAAPVEFTDYIGVPLMEALCFVQNCLVGLGIRDKMRLICSGKIISGFDMFCKLSLGADMCNSARGMMFSLGCIQSRRCNTNKCPTGIATQDPDRYYALDIDRKAPQVANFHRHTITSLLEVMGAAGISNVAGLNRENIFRRISPSEIKTYADLFPEFVTGQLMGGERPGIWEKLWKESSADTFARQSN